MTITDTAFWKAAWKEAADQARATHSDLVAGQKQLRRWNKMAEDFSQRTASQKAKARRKETLRHLRDKEILHPRARILDIGAGPGAWALDFARHCAHVTALEPAPGMTEILTARILDEKADNISVDQRTWQEVDVQESGWEGAFDLVFAAMTPGIDSPEALVKMMAASRGFCYLSSFSGPGWQQQFAPLWETFFTAPMPDRPNDIIYPFNLLHAMGFTPDLTFSRWDREILWDRDHTLRHFISFFESHMEITPEAGDLIAGYVDTLCPDGCYRPPWPVSRGTLIWQVSGRVSPL